MADIGVIKSHSVEREIIDPGTGEGTGFFVTLRSLDNPVLKRVRQAGETEGLQLLQRRKVPKPSEREEHANNVIIAAIESWRWGTDAHGEPATIGGEQPALSDKAVLSIIEVFPNFRVQIEEFYEDQKSFFRK